MTFAHRGAGLGYSGGLPAPAGPMVARSTCKEPSSRFTPVIVTAEPTLMSVIRAARAIQIAVSGPMVIFRSPSLWSATVRTGPSGEAFVFLIVATRCALSGPGSGSGLFDPGANKTI